MDDPRDKDKFSVDLSRVDSINNIDTARMTLRWALERLNAVEKRLSESQQAERQAHLLVELQGDRLQEQLRQAEREKSALLSELNQRKQKPQDDSRIEELRKRLEAAEAAADMDARELAQERQLRKKIEEEKVALQERFREELAALNSNRGAPFVVEKPEDFSHLQDELARLKEQYRKREAVLKEREEDLERETRELAQQYRKKQAQIESLKSEAEREIADLALKYLKSPPRQDP